ncbi:yls2-like, partial [Stylosanthes scabra]|nr:yls2-like [Stylosanthes scabra]
MQKNRISNSPRVDSPSPTRTKSTPWLFRVSFLLLIPLILVAVLFRIEPFDPVHFPVHEITRLNLAATVARNNNMLRGSEVVGKGHVAGPEDLVYDEAARVVYTGCEDGWIKRVRLSNDSVSDSVEDWVNTGGRPLGLAFDHHGSLIVGDANK